MEQFVAKLVDGGGINEGFTLHNVEKTETHLDLDTHFEPLVIDVEARAKFACDVETFRDQVVDEFVAVGIGFFVVLLRGKVELGIQWQGCSAIDAH